ncbi:MAG: hypothetical protein VX529_08680 [Pseudomonadota bacterium]|nr:hypothetical protein [Pseudomonadota bacterium]
MTDENPMFNAHLDLLIHNLAWSDDVGDEVRTLVAGNIRGAIGRLIRDGILIPTDEIDRRVIEACEGVGALKAAHRPKVEDTPREAEGRSHPNLSRLIEAAERVVERASISPNTFDMLISPREYEDLHQALQPFRSGK